MNIYIHTRVDQALANRIIEAFGEQHALHFSEGTYERPPEAFRQAEAILGNPPLNWFEEHYPTHLKLWQLDSAGFDQYKSLATPAKVANMGDWFAWPCAETIVGGILSLYRGLNQLTVFQKKKQWVGAQLREELQLLHKKQVVILGSGTIGLAVKSIVDGFGTSPRLVARTSPEADIHSREELFEILPSVDLVINTLPGAAGKYVDRTFFEKMKDGSVYANVGRGSTTDEAALIEFLKNNKLAGAVLDVTAIEPLPSDSPLWDMEHVMLTQHTGGGRSNEDEGKVTAFIDNFYRLLNDEPLINQVVLSKGY